MINIQKNVSLKSFHTFHTEVFASELIAVKSQEEALEVIQYIKEKNKKFFILGGGSNILFTKDFDGLIIKNEIKGIKILEEDEDSVEIEVGAGEDWNEFVNFATGKNFWGVENLACIPGSVGASAVQNIGAYGAQANETITRVEFLNLESGDAQNISNAECKFGYRDSIFKQELQDKALITSITFKLSRTSKPNIEYGELKTRFAGNSNLVPTKIAQAICEIRASKLPNPTEIGSAGSFFKNPIIAKDLAEKLRAEYPMIPCHEIEGGESCKLSAGWLIEECGWKGYRSGDAGIYEKHALVLVNYGSASGAETLALAKEIKDSVKNKFGLVLEEEVIIL